jgi:hypothetical protein
VYADLDTLLTALYVKIDDLLTEQRRGRRAGRPPRFTDAELVTAAVAQAVLQVPSERRWLRIIDRFLAGMFPHLPQQPGYNKRLRAALPLLKSAMRELATDCDFWHDDVWIIDSTPVECARSIATRRRSALAGWASYGHCSAHNRFFWGLRLHLVCTPHGLPITWALAGAKLDEREVMTAIFDREPQLLTHRPGQTIIADRGYTSICFEADLAARGTSLLMPAYRNRRPRPGAHLTKPVRQLIEAVNGTRKAQLDLERHGGRTLDAVAARIAQRILALTAVIWHNHHTGQPVMRSLIAYDH